MHSVLAARTDFSLGEAVLTPKRLVAAAKEAGARVVALTDTMSVTGMIDFTNRAKEAGIKPIIGCRLRVTDDPTWRPAKGEKKKHMPKSYMLPVYALSAAGMQAIYRLLTLAGSDERFYYDAKLGFEDVCKELDRLAEDESAAAHLAFTTGDTHGLLEHPEHAERIDQIIKRGKDRIVFFASLVPVKSPYFARINELAIDLIEAGMPPLTVRPSLYVKGEDDALEVLGALASNTPLSSVFHKRAHNDDLHVMSDKEMIAAINAAAGEMKMRGAAGSSAHFKQGLFGTDKLVALVGYEWSKAAVSLPKMAPDEFAEVTRQCKDGFAERFKSSVFGHKPSKEELRDIYAPRLRYELGVLRDLKFSGYFLLVKDVVEFAKSNGILVGPGRGSVGGSLVAYLMGITDCDPVRFDLLFERFINPDRIDLPDIDLDFMAERRHEIFAYLVDKYGAERVSGVSNFSKMAAASCIRDIGKMFGLTDRDTRCSKIVPKAHGANVPLPACAEQVPDIKEFAEQNPAMWDIMVRLEGTMRSYGRHAAGVVVGGCDLVERGVVERRKDGATINWDKRIVEDMGLVKMDILGLETLDVINLATTYIRERHKERINLLKIPLDDPEVLSQFAAGQTTGVFQFESAGMRRLLKELGKDGRITFEDITAATALYRPGPMESGMMDSYYRRKQGHETVEYDHPLMEPILRETYGVMVYQEQVMKVAREIAGYSAPDADKLRKIMGKKLPEEMKKERGKFVEGCVRVTGRDEHWAGALFDKIEGFAGYGFNKSHSVEYTLISWQCMWLKTHYPVEFYAAALTLMKEDKLPGIIRDAERIGIDVSTPDINISTNRFEIVTSARLAIPFQRIKGVGPKAVEAIVEAQKGGPFKSKEDFLGRVNKRACNVKVQDLLDRVGAFCRIEPGQPPAKDPSRIKDLIDLIPGLINEYVPIDREMHRDKITKQAIEELVALIRIERGPLGSNPDGDPSAPHFGRKARFMIVTDAPTHEEEASDGGFSQGKQVAAIREAMDAHDLSRDDVYWTGLIKRMKADKQVSSEEIALYKDYLLEEISILKPPVIALIGTAAVRFFLPEFKGKASEAAGKVVYSKEHDANLVIGFNPGEIYFDPSKQTLMEEVFKSVMDLLP